MTNRERLNTLSDDDLTEWLCRQMWPYYGEEGALDAIRFHEVRNFLKMEYEPESRSENIQRKGFRAGEA